MPYRWLLLKKKGLLERRGSIPPPAYTLSAEPRLARVLLLIDDTPLRYARLPFMVARLSYLSLYLRLRGSRAERAPTRVTEHSHGERSGSLLPAERLRPPVFIAPRQVHTQPDEEPGLQGTSPSWGMSALGGDGVGCRYTLIIAAGWNRDLGQEVPFCGMRGLRSVFSLSGTFFTCTRPSLLVFLLFNYPLDRTLWERETPALKDGR